MKKIYTSQGPGISNTWVTTVSTTDYLDGFQYLEKTPSGNGLTDEGLDTDNDLELAMEREAFQKEIIVDPLVDPGGGTTVENAVLQFVPTAEGYYSFTENRYIYQYKDHLGNTRVSFARNSAGGIEVTDKNDYYPFGMNHLSSDAGSYFGQSSYKNYKYNGKELQETGMYDYGARMYMPDIGRWGVQDLLDSFTLDPYGYANNNPIFFNDPTGMFGEGTGPGGDPEFYKNGKVTEIQEVVITKVNPVKGQMAGVSMPSNCIACFASGTFNIDLPPLPKSPPPSFYRPVLNNGAAYMMGGDMLGISDLAGLYLAKIKAQNRYVMLGIGLLAIIATKGQAADDVIKAEMAVEKAEMTTLYRSPAELKDIASNGLRSGGGYETSKLFTTTAKDASFFSKNMGWKWDGTANTIIKVDVPGSVMKQSTVFTADGIKSISIPSNLFQNVKTITPLNHSPIP